MTKTLLAVLGAVLGLAQGTVLFAILNASISDLINGAAVPEWGYGVLIFGGVGAIVGAVLGWIVGKSMDESRAYVTVLKKLPRMGDRINPPKGPIG